MAASFRPPPPHCFIISFPCSDFTHIGPEVCPVVSFKANLQRYCYLRLQDPDSLSRRHYNYLLHTVPTWPQKRSASGRTETPALSPQTNMLILHGYLENPFSNIMEVLCDLIINNTLEYLKKTLLVQAQIAHFVIPACVLESDWQQMSDTIIVDRGWRQL